MLGEGGFLRNLFFRILSCNLFRIFKEVVWCNSLDLLSNKLLLTTLDKYRSAGEHPLLHRMNTAGDNFVDRNDGSSLSD